MMGWATAHVRISICFYELLQTGIHWSGEGEWELSAYPETLPLLTSSSLKNFL
jgi:hypothetical protein